MLVEFGGGGFVVEKMSLAPWTQAELHFFSSRALSQQAYIKASNTGADDNFGFSVSLSSDGNTLAVGALNEDSSTTGINSAPNEGANAAGAVYTFVRDGVAWSQQAYIKASNTVAGDAFGMSVSLSSGGNTLAVGAHFENSSTTGINSTPNEGAFLAGAVYLFTEPSSVFLSSIDPTFGPTDGGNTVSLYGQGFSSGMTVMFGPNPATNVVAAGDGMSATCIAPSGTGAVVVSIGGAKRSLPSEHGDYFNFKEIHSLTLKDATYLYVNGFLGVE